MQSFDKVLHIAVLTGAFVLGFGQSVSGADCNSNGVDDIGDIAGGTSLDCNSNGVPDECDTDIEFDENPIFNGTGRAFSVIAADIDGDGDTDVFSSTRDDDTIAWHENTNGLGDFGPRQTISTAADWPISLFAADIDGDGDPDVLSASFFGSEIAWYENTNGLNGFGPQQIISTDVATARSVFAADIDGDGDVDVISASEDDDKIAWYENTDGGGTFGPQQIISTDADLAIFVFAADMDGDDDNDVLSASINDDKIAWYENTDGLGNFGSEQIISTAADKPRSVVAADIDGDGDNDVLSASANDDTIGWFENTNGVGNFGNRRVISNMSDGAISVFAVDMDADGDVDAVSASADSDTIAWHENLDGAGGFGPPIVISTAADLPFFVFAADVDGDQEIDVLSASRLDTKIAWYKKNGGDCNDNNVPDECELEEDDCNTSGVPDSCDIAAGSSEDCNKNGEPDECESDIDEDLLCRKPYLI